MITLLQHQYQHNNLINIVQRVVITLSQHIININIV